MGVQGGALLRVQGSGTAPDLAHTVALGAFDTTVWLRIGVWGPLLWAHEDGEPTRENGPYAAFGSADARTQAEWKVTFSVSHVKSRSLCIQELVKLQENT